MHDPTPDTEEKSQLAIALMLAGAGVLFTPIAMFFAVLSAGSGHGHYVAARVLYPMPLLLTIVTDNSIGDVSMVASALQFPCYGFVSGITTKPLIVVLCIVLIHGICCALTFLGAVPGLY
jgi:hypothetical protein